EKIRIETTQNVYIEYELASIGDRILATIIDSIIVWSYIIIWVIILISLADSNTFNGTEDIWLIMIFIGILLPYLLYDLVSEIFMNGQTIGKKQRNIKVIRTDGNQPTINNYLLRWLLRPIDMVFYGGLAVVVISANGRGQRLGDIAAGTTVIKVRNNLTVEKSLTIPDIEKMYVPTYLQVTLLNDKDINIIREVLRVYKEQKDDNIVTKLAEKIRKVLQAGNEQANNVKFLKTIIKDYTYLAEQAE
ncbi:MAG: RDD family protein, partial [Bacteroidota bacterium]